MIVDHRSKQVVGRTDGVEVAGEVQVDVFHRHDLRTAPAGRATLDAETGSERGLPQTNDGAFAQPIQRVAKPHGGGGFALTGRRRAHRCHQNELAVGTVLQALDVLQGQLGLEVAIWFKVFRGDAVQVLGQSENGPLVRGLSYFDVGHRSLLLLTRD